jgi:hypothetical protein
MKYLLLTVSIFSALFAKAQNVSFAHSNDAYRFRVAGDAIENDSIWDDPSSEWDISLLTKRLNFPFYAEGFNLDTFLVEDGYITNADGSFAIGNFSDLVDKGSGGMTGAKSPISLHRIGTAPNRVVIVQWANHGFYGDLDLRGQCTDSGHMQLWIYETGNKIEMKFGNSYIRDFSSTMADYTLMGYYTTDGLTYAGMSLEGNPANPTSSTDLTNSTGLVGYPSAGKVYSWVFGRGVGTRKLGLQNPGFWFANGCIYFKEQGYNDYAMMDMSGKLIKQGKANSGMEIANGIAPGVYMLRSGNTPNQQLLKVVVE